MHHSRFSLLDWPLWLTAICALAAGMFPCNKIEANILSDDQAASCSICHIDWMPEIGENTETLIPIRSYVNAETGKQKVTSTKRMCFTCHDGFVNDSRFQFTQGAHTHPVGVKPSKKIRVMKSKKGVVYPLNEDGKLYCGTCHTAHGNDWNKNASALFMRTKNINSSLCRDCHIDYDKSQHNNHPMALYKKELPEDLLHNRSMFGKGQKVICQTCHVSHGSKGEKLLVVNNEKSRLCIVCHANKKQLIESKHDLTNYEYEVSNAKQQSVREGGPCSGCHVSHGGQGKPLLAITTVNDKENDAWMQCLYCHSDEGIGGKANIGHFSHPIDVAINKLDINVTHGLWEYNDTGRLLKPLPLFDESGSLAKNGGDVRCPTCHDAHGTNGATKSFLRIKQGKYSELCINCHVRQANIVDTKHDINIYDNKKRSKINRDNKGEGVCFVCHKAHTGDAPYMLTLAKETAATAVSLIANQCSRCHKKNAAAPDSTVGQHSHPISVTLEEGMSSYNLPLFSFSGKRARNTGIGRVDCATCHNVHQWDPSNPSNGRQKELNIIADGSNSFLRLASDNESDLCTGCHEKQAQIIGSGHDLRKSAKDVKNVKNQTAAESGVCGQCHGAHNTVNSNGLWMLKPGNAKDAQTSYCRSCHNNSKIVTNKAVPNGKHPENVLVWSTPRRNIPEYEYGEKIPVFSPAGERKDIGIISCPSCHDPHQWQGIHGSGISGQQLNVNNETMFLRKTTVGKIVCADCHGLDALFRYQYFHSKTSSKKHTLFID